MKFKDVLFWCEFPLRADWGRLEKALAKQKLKAKCYIAVESKKDFLDYKKELKKYRHIAVEGAWPTLPLENGYWFSSFLNKSDIALLEEFNGMKIKIDIEPPYRYFRFWVVPLSIIWAFIHLVKKEKNSEFFLKTIKETCKNNDVILSSFPMFDSMLEGYGFERQKNARYNYMYYSSMINPVFRPIYRFFYERFMEYALSKDKDTYFAAGLLSRGIFNAEPCYKNVSQFKADIKFLLENRAKNLVVYSIEGLSLKKDIDEWIRAIRDVS